MIGVLIVLGLSLSTALSGQSEGIYIFIQICACVFLYCLMHIVHHELILINSNATQQSFSLLVYVTPLPQINAWLMLSLIYSLIQLIQLCSFSIPLLPLPLPSFPRVAFFSSLRLWQPTTGGHVKLSTWPLHVLSPGWMSSYSAL